MNIIILDTETTGFKEPQLVEMAYLRVTFPELKVLEEFEQRYKPTKSIEFGAMATHHILEEDLVDCPPVEDCVFPECNYLIGHNIDYDWEVLRKPKVKRIDTLALARKFLPDLDSHTQSALLYYFEGPKARNKLKAAHSALADIHNCRIVLSYLLDIIIGNDILKDIHIDSFYNISEEARIPMRITFGKYAKEKPLISDVKKRDPGYINWLLKQPDLDPYLRKALLGR